MDRSFTTSCASVVGIFARGGSYQNRRSKRMVLSKPLLTGMASFLHCTRGIRRRFGPGTSLRRSTTTCIFCWLGAAFAIDSTVGQEAQEADLTQFRGLYVRFGQLGIESTVTHRVDDARRPAPRTAQHLVIRRGSLQARAPSRRRSRAEVSPRGPSPES